MKGINIRNATPCQKPSRIDRFDLLFQPVLEDLGALHWLTGDEPVFHNRDDDALLEQMLEEQDPWGVIPPHTLLPRYARNVCSDGLDLFGFAQRPDEREFRAKLWKKRWLLFAVRNREWLGEACDVCIFNIDGAYWDFFAKDPRLLDRLRAHLAAMPAVTAEDILLKDRNV